MSRTRVTLAQTLKSWDTLNTSIKPLLGQLSTAATQDQTDFETAIGQVRSLSMAQDSLTGQSRDTRKNRLAAEQTAKALHDRLAAHLQAKFGPRSDLLLEFAVKPRRTGRRKKAATPETPPQPQPEVAAPAATAKRA